MWTEPLFTDAVYHMVRIAAAIAAMPLPVVRRVMQASLGHVPPSAVDELLLQSYLFSGFPRTLNAAGAWREISGNEAPAVDAAASIRAAGEWPERGELVCRTVYGDRYEALRRNVHRLHPALDEWMVVDGYGKVLARPGLSLAERELCIVASCAAGEQLPQLRAHLRGALNCGATWDDITQTLDALTEVVPDEALASAREELTRIREG
ncbi:MAG: carboxymuconolactone decarboxylase family protein [Gemmatimonadaceae bacterium]